MSQRFPNVWYATPEKLESTTKFVVFSDRGSLEVLPDQLQYRGKKVTLSLRKVAAVFLTRQRIPWVGYAVMNVAVVAYLAVLYSPQTQPRCDGRRRGRCQSLRPLGWYGHEMGRGRIPRRHPSIPKGLLRG